MPNTQTMTHRERAAVEAHYRAMSIGELAYDAWLAALRAYGDDSPLARVRVNQVIAASH
ncbi:MAG: hypothetical protein HKN28_09365 [Alphaproteobacteria bacterium]|nr:hypothetical protein [Alphaproteobacteria bacterium]